MLTRQQEPFPRRTEVSVAKPKKRAKTPKRTGAAPTASALHPLRETSGSVASGLAKTGALDNRLASRLLSLPVYGNYCGRGHGDPTYKTPPVDAVDLVCREHNRCYGLLGDFDSRCDRNFVEILPTAIAETPSQAGENAGLLALLYFYLAEPNLGLGETLFEGE